MSTYCQPQTIIIVHTHHIHGDSVSPVPYIPTYILFIKLKERTEERAPTKRQDRRNSVLYHFHPLVHNIIYMMSMLTHTFTKRTALNIP